MGLRVLLVFTIVASAPVFMAAQNQPSRAGNRQQTEQSNPTTPVCVNCNCTTKAGNGKEKPHGWHKLITWPEGIATWALIFTLGVIGWQAIETRRSVIVSLRPKLVLRGIEMLAPSESADIIPHRHIQIGVSNAGGTKARVTNINFTFMRETEFSDGLHIVLPAFPPYDPNRTVIDRFALRAGEHARRTIQLDDNMSFTLMLRDAGRQKSITVKAAWLCFGFLDYQDRLRITRRTGFAFRYDIGDNRFTSLDTPDYNYSD